MALKQGKCSLCGKFKKLMYSNNPLVQPACLSCIAAAKDLKNLENADFICRTYDLPFDPNMWIRAIKDNPDAILEIYSKYFLEPNMEDWFYASSTRSIWKEANKEWEKAMTHAELLEKIADVKEAFLERGRVKWGANFTFTQLIQLENLFSTTVASFDVNNPMQIDAIKKACKASLMLDEAMLQGEVKNIKDLTAAYQQFVKTAKIDEMIESAHTDVIRTVADLAQFLEDNNFQFTFYDGKDRDIVDKTIRDMKEHLRTLVLESTGLEQTLELIQKNYIASKREKADLHAQEALPIDVIIEKVKQEYSEQIDNELSADSILPEGDNDGKDYKEEDFE
jgi:hypothetical protein